MYVPKCVNQTRVAGGVGFLHAACSVNAQHRDATQCQLTLRSLWVLKTVTTQHAPGNDSNHPLESNSKGPYAKNFLLF